MICNQCPRKCNVDRSKTVGRCGVGENFKLARASLHFWEEPCISGKNGSGTVFFSGCNLGCVFCQNYEISHRCIGRDVESDELVRIFEALISRGANNINLVNPTHYALQLADVLSKWKSPVPIVYNSSGYESVETLKELDGLVDIYLPDFKYISSEKARKYSFAEDYPEVAMLALKEMKRQVGADVFDESGLMKKGMIIRHLVLPSNTNESIRVLDYLAENYGDTYISVMAQYTPCGNLTGYDEINRRLTKREYNKIVDYALSLGLDKIFIQDLSSAHEQFIPDFSENFKY